jgi:hypothetical protein
MQDLTPGELAALEADLTEAVKRRGLEIGGK